MSPYTLPGECRLDHYSTLQPDRDRSCAGLGDALVTFAHAGAFDLATHKTVVGESLSGEGAVGLVRKASYDISGDVDDPSTHPQPRQD